MQSKVSKFSLIDKKKVIQKSKEEIQCIAIQVIADEKKAIENLEKCVNNSFSEAVILGHLSSNYEKYLVGFGLRFVSARITARWRPRSHSAPPLLLESGKSDSNGSSALR